MPGGRKKLWRLFEEVEGDFTKVKCLVGGCPSVISRGPTGTARSKLNSSGMTNHAKAKHPEDYNEVMAEQSEEDATALAAQEREKHKDETEKGDRQIWHLRSKSSRMAFYKRACPDLVANVKRYAADSDEAKIRDRGVVAQIFLDLRPYSSCNRPGFLWHSVSLDPKYEVKSAKYYTGICDKVVAKAVSAMKARVKSDSPPYAQLCLDGWSAVQVGYIGANLGRC